jgi:hypothetical protein
MVKTALLDFCLLANLVYGRTSVGAGPNQLLHSFHQSSFSIAGAAHDLIAFVFLIQLCPITIPN